MCVVAPKALPVGREVKMHGILRILTLRSPGSCVCLWLSILQKKKKKFKSKYEILEIEKSLQNKIERQYFCIAVSYVCV